MKHCKNKSNIDIVKSYLNNERPFTQISMYQEEKKIYRNDGDKWKDKDGIKWTKVKGKNVRLTPTKADMIRELITDVCKCGQNIRWGSENDRKLFNRTGLCENCLIDYETKLRIVGIYSDYEAYKLISYELGALKAFREQISETIKVVSNNSGDFDMICNSEGFIERWKNVNREAVLEDAKKDLVSADARIEVLTVEKENAKSRYITGAAKFELETYVR